MGFSDPDVFLLCQKLSLHPLKWLKRRGLARVEIQGSLSPSQSVWGRWTVLHCDWEYKPREWVYLYLTPLAYVGVSAVNGQCNSPSQKKNLKVLQGNELNMKNLGVHLHFLIHNFSLWKRSAPLESRIFCLWTLGFGFYHVWVFVFIFKALGCVVSAGYSGHSGQLHVFDLPPPQYWSLSAWMASLGWALAAVGSYVVKCIVDTRGRCVLRSQPGQGRDIHPLQPCLG